MESASARRLLQLRFCWTPSAGLRPKTPACGPGRGECFPRADASSHRATFQSVRSVVRELQSTGVRKKALPDLLKLEPAPLALPLQELSARLDALVDAGV